MREKSLGKVVRFLLPSLKLKQESAAGGTVERDVHGFLLATFGGYTAATGNLFGFWTDEDGQSSYGEHREFTVGLSSADKLESLKDLLAGLAATLDEVCLYVEVGGEAILIYAGTR